MAHQGGQAALLIAQQPAFALQQQKYLGRQRICLSEALANAETHQLELLPQPRFASIAELGKGGQLAEGQGAAVCAGWCSGGGGFRLGHACAATTPEAESVPILRLVSSRTHWSNNSPAIRTAVASSKLAGA